MIQYNLIQIMQNYTRKFCCKNNEPFICMCLHCHMLHTFVCPGIWPFAGPWSWLWFLPWCRTHVLLFGSLGEQNFHENQMEGKRNWMEKSNSVKSTTRAGRSKARWLSLNLVWWCFLLKWSKLFNCVALSSATYILWSLHDTEVFHSPTL